MTIAGIDLFGNLTGVGIALLAVVFFGSYFVKGAIGIGAMSPAILFGTMLVGPHHAILLGVITNAASHLQFLPQGMRDGDWRVVRQVMFGNFAGSILGIWIFGQVGSAWLTFLLGLTLGGVLIADMTNALERLSKRIDLRASSFVVPFRPSRGSSAASPAPAAYSSSLSTSSTFARRRKPIAERSSCLPCWSLVGGPWYWSPPVSSIGRWLSKAPRCCRPSCWVDWSARGSTEN